MTRKGNKDSTKSLVEIRLSYVPSCPYSFSNFRSGKLMVQLEYFRSKFVKYFIKIPGHLLLYILQASSIVIDETDLLKRFSRCKFLCGLTLLLQISVNCPVYRYQHQYASTHPDFCSQSGLVAIFNFNILHRTREKPLKCFLLHTLSKPPAQDLPFRINFHCSPLSRIIIHQIIWSF